MKIETQSRFPSVSSCHPVGTCSLRWTAVEQSNPSATFPYLPPTVSIVYPLLSEPFSCRGPSKPRRLHGLRLARCCFMRIGLETYVGSFDSRPSTRPREARSELWRRRRLVTRLIVSSSAQSRRLLCPDWKIKPYARPYFSSILLKASKPYEFAR